MKIIPAIDIYNKEAVRLYKGNYNEKTVYGNPVLIAKDFESKGAKMIHLVDLNGAKEGNLSNLDIVKEIVSNVSIPCELGGGVREISDIRKILNAGVSRVIIGSKALELEFLEEALETFGSDKIVVGIDSENMIIKTHGWLSDSNISSIDYGKRIKQLGIKNIIFTDIEKDGTLSGINLIQTQTMITSTNLNVIASGGASCMEDIKKAYEIGCEGIILGKSLYEGKINLAEAILKYEV